MDVLAANMEYHSQDYAAFMQQYGLPTNDGQLVRFVERNVISLQSDKMLRFFMPYYQNGSITHDIMVRGFISNFMGAHNILDWDSIILKVLLYGRKSESSKQRIFTSDCEDARMLRRLWASILLRLLACRIMMIGKKRWHRL